jgi:hypothetical protein
MMMTSSSTPEPLSVSRVRERVVITGAKEGKAPLVEAWRRAWISAYSTADLKKSSEEGIEEEELHGIRIKHYN